MAPLVAPDICRFAINGLYAGSTIANIIDMRIDDGGTGTRLDHIEHQAADIVNAWCDRVLPIVVDDYTFTSVSWVDLDSETGSTGIVTSGGDEVLPQNGSTTATGGLPGNTAALVTKVAPGGGRRTRNGRLYLVGVSEGATSLTAPSNLGATEQAAITTALDGFSADISNAFEGPGSADYDSNMVVVHTENQGTPSNPDIVFVGSNDVTAMICQSRLATQRRRLRR